MKVIYENKVKASGIAVKEFKDAGMFIIFGCWMTTSIS